MLKECQVQRVKQLLADGKLSYRKVAVIAGVSKGSVSAIASGKRPDYSQQQDDVIDPESQPPFDITAPQTRCSGCGGVVYQPCLLCNVRALARAQRRRPPFRRRLTRRVA